MGVAVLGQCYTDVVSAAAAVCGTYPTQAVTGSGSLVSYRCSSVANASGAINLVRHERDAGGVLTTANTTVIVNGPYCDQSERVVDTVELWGLMVGLCAAIWAGKRVLALFDNVRGES